MKKILLLLIGINCFLSLQAQVLFGTASDGGINGKGTLHQFSIDVSTQTSAFTFAPPDGEHPQFSTLLAASNGKLYGMTRFGGINGLGILFSYEPSNSNYTKLLDFDGSNGSNPSGSLVQGVNGKLYGMTTKGGATNAGTIFSYDPQTSQFAKLKDFDFTNGAWPYGKLTAATDGKLYGLASYGGSRNAGVIFCIDPSTQVYNKVTDFDGGSGGSPYGSLIQSADGRLYGMTTFGGAKGAGVIFSYDFQTSTYAVLTDFGMSKGTNPYGDLVEAADGRLYGLTRAGGYFNDGVIFSINKTSGVYARHMEFDGGAGGGYPYGSLTIADDGKLYGTTSAGGNSGAGVIFCLNTENATFSKVKDLDAAAGSNPQGTLAKAPDGKLYSMTTNGGNGDNGVIFSFDPGTSTFAKLKDFGANEIGSNAVAGVIKDANGKLYGMTEGGGSKGVGIIYCYDPATATFTNLHNFDGANGANPYGSLLLSTNGKLYGMTYAGGAGYGIIFSLDIATRTFTNLYTFDYTQGANPLGSLAQASNGKLYGMTYYGGTNGAGVIFSFDPATLAYSKLKDFDVTNGGYPQGSLMQFTDGKLYGMTFQGGRNSLGVLFSFDPANSVYAKLKDLGNTIGTSPTGNLMQATNGKLYGMTRAGGVNNHGVIFHYIPSTNSYKKLKDFDGAGGSSPYGSLSQAANGNLYGVTFAGGANNGGVVFSFNTANSAFAKLQEFENSAGLSPKYVTLTEVSCLAVTWYQDADGDGFGNAAVTQSDCVQPSGYVLDKTDCDDNNNAITTGITWYMDADRDGYAGDSLVQCARPENGFLQAELAGTTLDCNDHDATVHPNATEIPDDGIDQDCDGADAKTWYADADQDGYGDANSSTIANTQPGGFVADNTDCNDADGGVHQPATYYADADEDGYGDAGNAIQVCASIPPQGYVTDSLDCNDADVNTHAAMLYYLDADHDGYGAAVDSILVCASTPPDNYVTSNTDCDDNDAAIHPNAGETPDDGIDQDCDGADLRTWYADGDLDGYGDINNPVTANSQPTGFVSDNTDCNDTDNTIYPTAPELCDGKDNNCDGTIDENCPVSKIKIGDVAQTEGNTGTQAMVFTVSLTKISAQTVTVDFETKNGVAKAPADFVAHSGTLIFEPGVKTLTIEILIKCDLDVEGDETFKVLLSNPVNAGFQDSVGVGKILNDDGIAISSKKGTPDHTVKNYKVTVMPNPASTTVNVGLTGFNGKVTVQMLSAQGDILRQNNLFAGGFTIWHTVPVSDIAGGTYLLLVTDESGKRRATKLVISR